MAKPGCCLHCWDLSSYWANEKEKGEETIKEIYRFIYSFSPQLLMHARLLQAYATLRDPMDCIAHQAPLSMGFSRQEYWSGFQCPPPGHLPDPGAEAMSFASPALAGGSFTTSSTDQDSAVDKSPSMDTWMRTSSGWRSRTCKQIISGWWWRQKKGQWSLLSKQEEVF